MCNQWEFWVVGNDQKSQNRRLGETELGSGKWENGKLYLFIFLTDDRRDSLKGGKRKERLAVVYTFADGLERFDICGGSASIISIIFKFFVANYAIGALKGGER